MIPSTMKAIFLDQKALKVTIKRTPVPAPKDNEVLIKVVYAGICGSDLKMVEGKHPYCETPSILGHEFCGTVVKTGKDITHVKLGDKVAVDPMRGCRACKLCTSGRYPQCNMNQTRNAIGIFTNGGFAQYATVHFEQVFKVPDSIPYEQAVLSEPLSCVAHGYDRLGSVPIGTSVLIIGGGIIGTFWACTLHLQGHRNVVISEPHEARRKIIQNLGMNFQVVSPEELKHNKESDPELGFDLIIECSGHPAAVEEVFPLFNFGGRLLVFGLSSPEAKWTISPTELFFKELTIIASFVNPFSFNKSLAFIQSMGERYLCFDKLGVQIFNLEEYEDALAILKSGKITKAIFKIAE